MAGQAERRGRTLSGDRENVRLHLVVTDLEIGGTPRVVRELAVRLRGLGFDTAVTCLAPPGRVADEIAVAGVPVTSAGVTRPRDLSKAVRAVRRLTDDADVILSLLVHANVVASLANSGRPMPLVQSIQTTQPRPAWHWWAQAWAARSAAAVVVPSASVATAAVERSGVAPERLIVVPNAVERVSSTTVLRRTASRPASFRSRTRAEEPCGGIEAIWRVGFIGRLDPVKRVQDLVAAVARLDDVRLDIYGDGDERATIVDAVGRANVADRVTLHGAVASADAALAAMDTLVLPSEAEGFGLVLIEAMAAGVPVVATDAPGIRDVVRHGVNGLLVPVGRPDAIAAAIERVRSDERLRDRLVAGGHACVRHRYTWGAVLPMYQRLLAGVNRTARAARP